MGSYRLTVVNESGGLRCLIGPQSAQGAGYCLKNPDIFLYQCFMGFVEGRCMLVLSQPQFDFVL